MTVQGGGSERKSKFKVEADCEFFFFFSLSCPREKLCRACTRVLCHIQLFTILYITQQLCANSKCAHAVKSRFNTCTNKSVQTISYCGFPFALCAYLSAWEPAVSLDEVREKAREDEKSFKRENVLPSIDG